jgi:hypothetical protein
MKNILITMLALLIFMFGFLVGERYSNFRIPTGKELVTKSFLDSIKNLKPDTIVRDTIIYQDTIIYRDRNIPTPIPLTAEINSYVDSIVNDSTYLVIKDEIKGELLSRDIEIRRSMLIREINTPYPVIVERDIEVYTPPWSVYGNIITGGNNNHFMAGVGFGFINRKNTIIGGQILTDFENRFYTFTIGRKIDL